MDRLVRVDLAERSYGVHIGAGVLSRAGEIVSAALRRPFRRAFIVRDAGVPHTSFDTLADSLRRSGVEATATTIAASEQRKSLETLQSILVELGRSRHERFDPVIALGGGIVGDVAGFAAGIYRRGVPFVQCPTTLLAMVDASVGGKTGVNLAIGDELRKNFVGAFHQPAAVLADPRALYSLPEREFRCGLAECVKHGLIGGEAGDPGLLDWIIAELPRLLAREEDPLTELITRNVAIKAAIVSGDEREEADDAAGGRALLNLGHTFGHAIETISHLSPDVDPAHAPLHHGEAVGLGLVAAARCAAIMGLCDRALPERVAGLLERIGLPTRVRGLPDSGEILARMKHDKKVLGDAMRLVLPTSPGMAAVVRNPPVEAIRTSIEGIRLQDIS